MSGVHNRAAAKNSLLRLGIFIKSSVFWIRALRGAIALSSDCKRSSRSDGGSFHPIFEETVPFWDGFELFSRHFYLRSAMLRASLHPAEPKSGSSGTPGLRRKEDFFLRFMARLKRRALTLV